jgi:hypothetical protein
MCNVVTLEILHLSSSHLIEGSVFLEVYTQYIRSEHAHQHSQKLKPRISCFRGGTRGSIPEIGITGNLYRLPGYSKIQQVLLMYKRFFYTRDVI